MGRKRLPAAGHPPQNDKRRLSFEKEFVVDAIVHEWSTRDLTTTFSTAKSQPYWEIKGTGPAVLLIAGTPGDGGQFDRVATELAARRTVITYYGRGTARSLPILGWSSTSGGPERGAHRWALSHPMTSLTTGVYQFASHERISCTGARRNQLVRPRCTGARQHGSMRRLLRHPVTWAALSVAVIGLVAGLWLFQPWKLWTHTRVDEAIPVTANQPANRPADQPGLTGTGTSAAPKPAPQPEVLAEGAFVSGEHNTSGTAKVLRLSDGSRVLRLENFSTSDGPDVHVWLTDAQAGAPSHSFDDGRYLKLGKLKATDGNQNYPIPAEAKLDGLRSAVIWCDRFNVAFGSVPLSLSAAADAS
jgi:pimeloyl-ACP methyl ester carboxylesterase